MPSINTISGGARKQTKTVTAGTSNKTVTPDEGYLLSSVVVQPTPVETTTVAAGTSNKTVTPNTGYFLSSVTVTPTPTQNKSATPTTSAQTIKPDTNYHLGQVTVNAIVTETKTATPTAASQSITPSSGKYLSKVTVNPINVTFSSMQSNFNMDDSKGGKSMSVAAGLHYGILIHVGSSNANNNNIGTTFGKTGGITAITQLQSRVALGRLSGNYCQVQIYSVTGNGSAGTITHTGGVNNNERLWLYKIY